VLLVESAAHDEAGLLYRLFGVVAVEARVEAGAVDRAGVEAAGVDDGVEIVVAVGRFRGDDGGPVGGEASGDLGQNSPGLCRVVEAERGDGQVDVAYVFRQVVEVGLDEVQAAFLGA
jgi:hypothetical protein